MQNYPMNYQPQYNYPPMLQCKIVDGFEQITAMDVPMDGKPAVFIKRDLSEIQTRSWGSDGRIYPMVYVPYRENSVIANNATVPNENMNGLNERLQAIEEKIDKLIKPTTAKKGTTDANA